VILLKTGRMLSSEGVVFTVKEPWGEF